jgi:hypothetical protein
VKKKVTAARKSPFEAGRGELGGGGPLVVRGESRGVRAANRLLTNSNNS